MAATIDIISGNSVKHQAVYESGSVRHFELMTEDYVRLVFKSAENFAISIGDRITVDGKTYVVTTLQKPTFNKNTGGYDYDVRFDAYYWLYNNKIFKFEPATLRNEASFSLTDTLEHHMDIVVRNLAACGFVCTYDGLSGVADADKHIYIYYDGLHIIDAITHICETFHCEWWIEGNIIHLGKAQRNDAPVRFEVGVNVEDMGSEKGNRELVTRLYAFGSTRNIPFDYRKNDAQVLLNGVVQKRLMLPEGTPYIQIQTVSDEQAVEGMVFFDDIYPKMDNAITSVESRNEEVESEVVSVEGDTETTTETVPIYRFKDSSLTFRQSYILAGQTLQIQFQSGLLNGMTFDLSFNPDGLAEDILDEHDVPQVNPEAQVFEVVRNDTYGLMLPNDVLKPQVGDEFVLLGWDVRKLEDGLQLITEAEQELKDRADLYMQDLQTDTNVYPCTMMSDYMYGLDGSTQNPAFSKVDAFPLGLPVTLVNETFFDTGSRLSRVIGWEFKLDKPYDGAIIYVGESATYSSKRATADSIQNVKNDVNYKVSGIGSGMNESQFSILLQAYGAKLFLSKVDDDVAGGQITFMHGFLVGVEGIWGYVKEFIEDGVTTVKAWFKNLSADILQVLDHIKGPLTIKGNTVIAKDDNNQGGSLSVAGDTNINGKLTAANAEILNMLTTKNLTVTGLAHFFELVIDKIKAAGGAVLVTPANGFKVEVVEHVSGGYKLYWSAEDDGKGSRNMWKGNDQAICQNFNGARVGTTFGEGNKYYWALVTDVSGDNPATVDGRRMHWIVISTSVCVGDPSKAEVGDEIAMLGYRGNDDAPRQSAIYLAAYNSLDSDLTAPLLAFYKGINDFDLKSHRTTYIDAQNAVFKGRFLSTSTSSEGIDIEALLSGSEFDIIYGFGNPNTVSPAPHATWTTPAMKLLHVGTLYFDLDLEPASEGGRLYRWQKVETGAEYYFDGYAWVAISDIDTLSALDKIADVASDGKLSGGAEKTRVYLQWMDAKKTTLSLLAQAHENKLDTDNSNYVYKDEGASTEATCGEAVQDLEDSFKALSAYLNNKSSVTDWVINGSAIPVWIDPQNTQTGLNVTTELPKWTENSKYSTLSGADVYRRVWDDFFSTVVELTRALNAIQYKNIDEMGDDGLIDPAEKAELRQTLNEIVIQFIKNYIESLALEDVVDDEVMTYLKVDSPVDNPSTVPYYEFSNGKYVATTDTSVSSSKTYYEGKALYDARLYFLNKLSELGTYLNGTTPSGSAGAWTFQSFSWYIQPSNYRTFAEGLIDPESGVNPQSQPDNIYPLWLQKYDANGDEVETQSTVVLDDQWDYFWDRMFRARALFSDALSAAKQYQIDNVEVDLPVTFNTNKAYTDANNQNPVFPPSSSDLANIGRYPKVGDRWLEQVRLRNPAISDPTHQDYYATQDRDGNPLYNVYVCIADYTSGTTGANYANRLSFWKVISKPTYAYFDNDGSSIKSAVFNDNQFTLVVQDLKSITSTVSKIAGSKNLILNADFSEVSTSPTLARFSGTGTAASPQREAIDDDDFKLFEYAAKVVTASSGTYRGLTLPATDSGQKYITMEEGKSYILSAWLKSTDGYSIRIYTHNPSTSTYSYKGTMTEVGGSATTLSGTWKRYALSITGDGAKKNILLCFMNGSSNVNNKTFYVAGIQLEEGSAVTNWQLGDGNIHLLQTQIKQLEDEIDLAVTKDGIRQSGITLNPNGCVIDGSKTTINGDLDVKGLTTENVTVVAHDSSNPVVVDMSSVKSVMVSPLNIAYSNAVDAPQLVVLPFWDSGFSSWTAGTSISFGSDGSFTLVSSKTVSPYKVAGTRLTITNAADKYCKNWEQLLDTSAWGASAVETVATWAQRHCVVVCSDGRIVSKQNVDGNKFINPTNYADSSDMYDAGIFYCGGYITRFIALLPGQTLQLRSQLMTIGTRTLLVWMVENPTEFVPLAGKGLKIGSRSLTFGTPVADFSDARRGQSECLMGHEVLLRTSNAIEIINFY